MSNSHSPIKGCSLRRPAHTLRRKVYRKCLLVSGICLGGVIFYVGLLFGALGYAYIPYFFLIVTLLFALFALYANSWQKKQEVELDKLMLGLDGEVFTGEFLDTSKSENNWFVLHDFNTGRGNIDHIVIAPQGVFVIETKTVSQYEGESSILYDGKQIRTEKRELDSPEQQAKAEGAFLAAHINTKLTMNIFVQPIVTYPGWKLRLKSGKKLGECAVWFCLITALPKILAAIQPCLSREEQLRIYNFLASENHV